MRITKITTNNFTSSSKPQETSDKNSTDVLKMFHDKAKNSADMTDSILVPRTIFKGYLGIMTGTTLLTLSSFTSKFSKISKSLGILGALTSLYGIIDEIHQSFTPGRSCSVFDWFADTAGAAAGIFAYVLLLYILINTVWRTKYGQE